MNASKKNLAMLLLAFAAGLLITSHSFGQSYQKNKNWTKNWQHGGGHKKQLNSWNGYRNDYRKSFHGGGQRFHSYGNKYYGYPKQWKYSNQNYSNQYYGQKYQKYGGGFRHGNQKYYPPKFGNRSWNYQKKK